MRSSLPRIAGVAARIRRFLKKKKDGVLFSTRDLLGFGKRGAVDQTTRRMVDKGQLQRVARGVFCKISFKRFNFDALEVAYVKAAAFGKDRAKLSRRRDQKKMEPIYVEQTDVAICNSYSSFKLTEGPRIKLTRLAHRKIGLGDKRAGLIARAHWKAGIEQCCECDGDDFPQKLMSQLGKKAAGELFDQYRLLPAWLNDCLAYYRLQKRKFSCQ